MMKLSKKDLAKIAEDTKVGEDEIQSLLTGLSSGEAFDSAGLVRVALQPHLFYKNIKDPDVRDKAVQAGLAYPRADMGRAPNESQLRAQYEQAYELDPNAAMISAVWGEAEVPGAAFASAGYETAMGMIIDFQADGLAQVRGMAHYAKAEGLDKAAKKQDWEAVTIGYRGKDVDNTAHLARFDEAYPKATKTATKTLTEQAPLPKVDPKVEKGAVELSPKLSQAANPNVGGQITNS